MLSTRILWASGRRGRRRRRPCWVPAFSSATLLLNLLHRYPAIFPPIFPPALSPISQPATFSPVLHIPGDALFGYTVRNFSMGSFIMRLRSEQGYLRPKNCNLSHWLPPLPPQKTHCKSNCWRLKGLTLGYKLITHIFSKYRSRDHDVHVTVHLLEPATLSYICPVETTRSEELPVLLLVGC